MQINTKSWHYRIQDFLDFCQPNNLCTYCWMVLWSLFVLVVLWPLAIGVGGALLTSPLWAWLTPVFELTLVAFVIGIIEVGALLFILRAVIIDRRAAERFAGTRAKLVIKEPSLFGAWISAKHDKVCPILNFVRDEE